MTLGEALRSVRPADAGSPRALRRDRCSRRPRRDGAGASGLLGGVTGDIYGAVNETAEAAVLVLAVIILTAGAAGALPDA